MTERLYYSDSYLTEFRATVVDTADQGRRVYLDRSAFYPASGGQPGDLGAIGAAPVIDVIEEDDRIAHVLGSPIDARDVACRIDWARRFDHMQQHSGQHLLSAVLADLCRAATVGFHLGAEVSTVDVGVAALDAGQVARVERRVNELVFENRPITIGFEDAAVASGVRKRTDREGELRIVTIRDCDRSACGGTHVRATGEIGPVLIRKLDKIRGNVRIEFLCGMRAVIRARADYDALSQAARALAAPLDETPKLVAAHLERLSETEKSLKKLAAELAVIRGRELYAAAEPGAAGVRRNFRRLASGTFDDELRATAQGFTSGERAVFVIRIDHPPSLMLAVSRDSGFNAGQIVKEAVTAAGGRGGGSPTAAQGSVPDAAALDRVEQSLRAAGVIAA
jgi:alanyl-tRNA synthetase